MILPDKAVPLEPVEIAAGSQAWRIVLPVPVPVEYRPWLASLTAALVEAAAHLLRLHATLWLDTKEMHRDGGSRLVSSFGRQWSPEMGFAFAPAGPRPRSVTLEDFTDTPFGTPIPVYNREAIFVSRAEATASATATLTGRGMINLLFFPAEKPSAAELTTEAKKFKANSRRVLEPMMASKIFRNHLFYLPLLSSAGLASTAAQQTGEWLGNAEMVLRENPDDGEVLLFSTRDLRPLFRELGLEEHSDREGRPGWSVPARTPREVPL